MTAGNHFFHLVNLSPWPILTSVNLISTTLSLILFMNLKIQLTLIPVILVVVTSFQWWRDAVRESLYQGMHTYKVKLSIMSGMVLFILSELLFFFSFFWSFFYMSLNPDISLGNLWPPFGLVKINYLSIPFLNTLILLSSGIFITLAHYLFFINQMKMATSNLAFTIWLGIYFMFIQFYEYKHLAFDLTSGNFSSLFFILTGFHGFHVIIGILFISTNFFRLMKKNFSTMSMLGFEYAIWYWHFVDVVWLFLFMFVYWWGM